MNYPRDATAGARYREVQRQTKGKAAGTDGKRPFRLYVKQRLEGVALLREFLIQYHPTWQADQIDQFIAANPTLSVNRSIASAQLLQSQIIIHRDLDVLLGAEIALGGLDRGVAEQELDLLQVPAVLPAELGAGAAQVVGAEVLDADLLR